MLVFDKNKIPTIEWFLTKFLFFTKVLIFDTTYRDVKIWFISNYPEFITSNYVERLSTFIDYAKSMIQNAQPITMSDIFDKNFFDNYDESKKQVVIEKLFESMFVSNVYSYSCWKRVF